MRSYWIRTGPRSNGNVLIIDRKGHTEAERRPCEKIDRDFNDEAMSQGMSRIAGRNQKLGNSKGDFL